jgi:hypothetical protein
MKAFLIAHYSKMQKPWSQGSTFLLGVTTTAAYSRFIDPENSKEYGFDSDQQGDLQRF